MEHRLIHLRDLFPPLGEAGADPTLTLYLPSNLEGTCWEHKKRPCLIICPGGAYAFCCPREAEPVALSFLTEGFNAFVLDYSPTPHHFPTQLREVAAVMELIYQNQDAWNCDVSKIAITGFSAGGHLAAHYSTGYDCAGVRELFPDSKPVNASILCYPVITADPAYAHQGSIMNLSGHDSVTEEDIAQFSCEKLVTEHTPPAFLWHTAADDGVPVMNSLLYAGALSKYRIPFTLHVYTHGWHGLSTVDSQSCNELDEKTRQAHDWVDAARKWLKVIF